MSFDGFVHRTFLEYFCAVELTRRLQQDPEYSIDQLIREVVSQRWRDPAWHEVLRLLCGMVGDLYAGRIIEFLSRDADPHWQAEPKYKGAKNLILATRCLSEVRNRSAIEALSLELLKAIVALYENQGEGPSWFARSHGYSLYEAAKEVGSAWPGSAWFRSQFVESLTKRTSPEFLSSHALLMIVLFPRDQDLRNDLFSLALEGEFSLVRVAALDALAECWTDEDGVRELIWERAMQDENPIVRGSALELLAINWGEEPSVRELIQRQALQDESSDVRDVAITAITLFAKSDLGTERRELL